MQFLTDVCLCRKWCWMPTKCAGGNQDWSLGEPDVRAEPGVVLSKLDGAPCVTKSKDRCRSYLKQCELNKTTLSFPLVALQSRGKRQCECSVAQLRPTLCDPMDCSCQLPCSWASQEEHWVRCHFLLQEIFPTQGSHPDLLSLLYQSGKLEMPTALVKMHIQSGASGPPVTPNPLNENPGAGGAMGP